MIRGFRMVLVAGLLLPAGAQVGPTALSSEHRPPITYNIVDLGTLVGLSSVALAINENGQVVGSADTPEGYRHAYLWKNGKMIDLVGWS